MGIVWLQKLARVRPPAIFNSSKHFGLI